MGIGSYSKLDLLQKSWEWRSIRVKILEYSGKFWYECFAPTVINRILQEVYSVNLIFIKLPGAQLNFSEKGYMHQTSVIFRKRPLDFLCRR
jgi:hypothetical protein